MNRRGFLGGLLGSLAALAAAPGLKSLPSSILAPIQPSPVYSQFPSAPEQIHRLCLEALRRLKAHLPLARYELVQSGLMGEEGLRDVHGVAFYARDVADASDFETFSHRYLEPAMQEMAWRVGRDTRFGQLPIQLPGAEAWRVNDARAGLSLRAVQQYRITHDDYFLRLDVVTG